MVPIHGSCHSRHPGFFSNQSRNKLRSIYDLIFLPGFSTAQNLSEVSGRGVGMDVVLQKIHQLRGEVEIESKLGIGTTFTIKLPQTVSILETMMVTIDKFYFLIPLSVVRFCEEKAHHDIFKTHNNMIDLGNQMIPLVYLRNLFKLKEQYPETEKIIFIQKNENHIAIVVDNIIGEYQAVLKPFGYLFKGHTYFSGAAIMANGSVAIMIDTNKLM